MITGELVGGEAAIDRLRALPEAANAGLARAIAELGLALQNNVQQNKLSGQVLRIRSGTLKSSIDFTMQQRARSITATVLTNLDYAAAQEYGVSGTANVKASLRLIKEAFGRPIAGETIGVGAYSRRMDLPERSFLRSALDDMASDITSGVQDALWGAIT
jgi:phage gpG-like protein